MPEDYKFGSMEEGIKTLHDLGFFVTPVGYVVVEDSKEKFQITPPYPIGTIGFLASSGGFSIFRVLVDPRAIRAIERIDSSLGIYPTPELM